MFRPTTILESPRLNQRIGIDLFFASETFQYTGSFKFRAAYHLASKVSQKMIIASSSGNFGQALAYACFLLGKKSIIVMPSASAQVKIDAVREYGGRIEFVDVTQKSRAERVQELAVEFPNAFVASPYDHPLVIEGNSTLGIELGQLSRQIDYILVPIGGGGLSAGIITGLNKSGRNIPVLGVEPELGNDAALSLRAGKLISNPREPQTLADGARTLSLGKHNWEILKSGLSDIIEVSEATLLRAAYYLHTFVNLKVEPTGALSLAAVMTKPEKFRRRHVCCVVSGGNVDPSVYQKILAEGEKSN